MPEALLRVELIASTPSPRELVALGARLCYSGAGIPQLRAKTASRDQDALIMNVMEAGHLSVLEHASFTFAIEGVSRVLLAQLTRHRIASYSVQSQRYVSLREGFTFVIPPRIKALGPEATLKYERQMHQMHQWYGEWQALLEKGEGGNEDARFVLPGACGTRLLLTMNARELRHFFRLRCCNRAQWEIRALAKEMLRLLKKEAPSLFRRAGPGCVAGPCPEGKRSCGRAAQTRAEFLAGDGTDQDG